MNLAALIAALIAQYAYPPPERPPLAALYGRLCLSTAKRFNAGDRNSGMLAYAGLVFVVLVPLALVAALAASIHGVVLLALNAFVLYGSLKFVQTTSNLAAIERSLREGDCAAASRRLGQWQGEAPPSDDPGATARLAAEHGLREAHQGTYAILFWFLVLPGPLGAVMYPLTQRAARLWNAGVEPDEREFGWFAGRAFEILDWVPQRVTAFVFAIVGDFEDALFCWRSQAAQWMRPEEGIVLASGAGALGVRLGEPIARGEGLIDRPALGTGEAAGEDALANLEGMLWRSLVLWLVAYLLFAALHGRLD
ncbi:MAG: regulatory signaling modulator protein AmpE [Betaproteobacteria bacterium]|nr:regulatory signaling modulator protein AmpE [Betaproteobacteria bacterium]